MKFHLIAAGALLVGGTAVLAQDAQQAPQQQTSTAAVPAAVVESEAEPEDPEGQEVVCRTERITGSLTRRRRTCMTRNEWAELERATNRGMNEMGRNASGGHECRTDQMGGC